jgi:hypothetical protein
MAKTIFVSLHHKRSLLFEEGIKLLLKDYPVVIQNTGYDRGFGEFGLKDQVEYIDSGNISYDAGLVNFKSILSFDWDVVHFIDNDLFITDTKYIKDVLNYFISSDFGYCSYFENGSDDSEYTGLISEVKNQTFLPADIFPGFYPKPHWENASMMFKREAWDKLSTADLSHGRLLIKAMVDKGIKMGVKKRKSVYPYSHYGEGWFHMGALMSYYYKVEDMNLDLDPNSKIDQERIGYFLYQRERFGDYAPHIMTNLRYITELMGEEKCLKAFKDLYDCHKAEDKVMSNE